MQRTKLNFNPTQKRGNSHPSITLSRIRLTLLPHVRLQSNAERQQAISFQKFKKPLAKRIKSSLQLYLQRCLRQQNAAKVPCAEAAERFRQGFQIEDKRSCA